MPLVRIYDPAQMRLEVTVRESLAASLSLGMRLSARLDALGRDVPVSVDEIVPAADPGSRAFLVKVSLPADPGIFPGMFGRLEVPRGRVLRLYIPAGAVTRIGQLDFVDVLTPEGVVRRQIRTGGRDQDAQVEVRSGLSEGERILVGGGS
jgi:hypothetical protein